MIRFKESNRYLGVNSVGAKLGLVSQTTTQPIRVGYVGRHPRDTLSSSQAIARPMGHEWSVYPERRFKNILSVLVDFAVFFRCKLY